MEDLAQEVFVRAFRNCFVSGVSICDVEELKINETTQVLNVSIPNVEARMHRTQVMLQERLAPQSKERARIEKEMAPVVMDCKHVWSYISEYLDGTCR